MPDPILVSGMDRHRARLDKWFNRASPRQVEPPEPTVFTNSDGSTNSAPAVEGYAAVYNQPFAKEGRTLMFAYGCFGGAIYDGNIDRKLLLDHDDRKVVGATDDGLVFANNLEGLVYRLPLRGNEQATEIKAFVESGKKACASVGCRILEEEAVEVDGVAVVAIKRAELHEVSLVYQGACDGTSSSIVDLNREDPDLRQSARKPEFAVAATISTVTSRLARVSDRVDRALQAIGRIEKVALPEPLAPSARAYTLNDANRWQTERTEQLQNSLREANA
jgi:HK97 family phage prohead protease